jgi:tRNA pseudouridine55 synthase
VAERNGGPDGVLLLDKPAGITSTRALAKAKRILGSLKGGHTGTLDPFATGLLPLVFGEATKFSRFLIDSRKAYIATLRLGEETATGDTESDVSARRAVDASLAQIDAVLASFLGVQYQTPPMHSAVHVDGRRLYEYARAGEEVERPARAIEVEALGRIDLDGNDLRIRVECSKGTYVRTLAQDIGTKLGCGAYLVALRRTGVGGFSLDEAVTFEALEAEGEATEEEALRFGHGRIVARAYPPSGEVAVYAPGGRFLGVGSCLGEGGIAPLRLMRSTDAKAPDFA